MRYYTGIGSRKTPIYILYMMSKLSIILEKKGFILRSGCATGADAAFEDSLSDPEKMSEIYIPNKSFPFKMGSSYKKYYLIPEEQFNEGGFRESLFLKATRMIHTHNIHKAWAYCSGHVMLLHNRNMFQVLGKDLKTPSSFTICYTIGKELTYDDTTIRSGGTATAINASFLNKVDVFNLSVDEHYIRLNEFIEKNDHLIDYQKLNDIKPRSNRNIDDNSNKREPVFLQSYLELMPLIIEQCNNRKKLLIFK